MAIQQQAIPSLFSVKIRGVRKLKKEVFQIAVIPLDTDIKWRIIRVIKGYPEF